MNKILTQTQLGASLFKFCIFAILMIFINCNMFAPNSNYKAKKGVLDLRTIQFTEESIALDGEWEFYWEQFLEPESPHNGLEIGSESVSKINYINTPSAWNENGYPAYGFATYRLRVFLPDAFKDKQTISSKNQELSISLKDAGTAYKIFINHELAIENGIVGKSKNESNPFLRNRSFQINTANISKKLNPKTKEDDTIAELEIIIHISNFHTNKSGILESIKLEYSNNLNNLKQNNRSLDHLVFGCLLIMGIHHLSIYLFRKKDKVPFYFGLFCILVAVRTISVNELYIIEYFPFLPFWFIYKLEYSSFYLGVPLFALFLHSLFPRDFSKKILRGFVFISAPLTMLAVFSTIEFYSKMLVYIQVYTFVFAIYSSLVVFQGVIFRRPGARLFCAGGFPFFWSIINDLLYNMQIIHTFYMGSYGFLIFIYFHSIALSKRFSSNISSAETLSSELQGKTNSLKVINKELVELKENLEIKVKDRTLELEKARLVTEEANQELEALNKFTKLINSTRNLDYILNQIYEYICKYLELEIFWLILVDKNKKELYNYKWILPENNLWDEERKLFLTKFRTSLNANTGTLYQTYISKEIFYLPDIKNFAFGVKNQFINKFNGKAYFSKRLDFKILAVGRFESLVQIPLIVNDETIGILNLAPFNRIALLERRELLSLIQFGEQIAGVIHNMHLLEETEKARQEVALQKELTEKTKEELEVLNIFNKMINELTDLDNIFNEVSKYIYERYNIEDVWLLLVDEKKNELFPLKNFVKSEMSESKIKFKNEFKIPLDESGGTNYILYKRQKPFYIHKIKRITYPIDRIIIDNLEVKSFLNVPMVIQGKTIGIVYFSNSTKEFHLTKSEISSINGFCQQIAGVIHNSHLLKETESAKKEAELEREKSDKLLLNILPLQVANELKEKGSAEPVLFESVTVLFTDFKGFTKIAEKMSPRDLIKELDGCFSQFDKITERYRLEKLKTIGDSYMCAGGIPDITPSKIPGAKNAIDAVLAAMEIQAFMNQMKSIKEDLGFPYWELRLGIHSGPLVAGVIGEKKFAYDVWGDTVNTASRMESSGTPGKINISGATFELVKDFFECEYRGKVNAKNKGEVDMYYVNKIHINLSKNGDGKTPDENFWRFYE